MSYHSRLSAVIIGLVCSSVLAAPIAFARPDGLISTKGKVLKSSAIPSLAGAKAISNVELSRIRGSGTGPGFSINFGFTIQSFVNGTQVQSISMSPVNVTPSTTMTESIIPTFTTSMINNNTPASQNTIIQEPTIAKTIIPIGNTSQFVSISNSIGSGGLTFAVNNTASNQVIQEIRTYNIDTTGLQSQVQSASSALSLQNSLNPH